MNWESDDTRQGLNIDDEALLSSFKSAAVMIDVWKRDSGLNPAMIANHAVLGWQDGQEGERMALVAAALKTGFGQ